MIHIPREEIKQPSLHADSLGFTFVWQGHFLRGIFPDSVELAMSYFDSGFLKEVTEKELFPKTWVSEFESEQFGMILEHEMIQPVLYATEWNSAMLKDAALMVLDIAEIGWKYGFNMVDCHKKNVMFRNNRPLYVDLGSFIPREKGCTGWKPYKNFLESYTYILDMWTHGSPQLAKRMMAPGVTIQTNDYLAWKRPLYRYCPRLIMLRTKISKANNDLAIVGDERLKGRNGPAKRLSSWLKPAISQHFNRLRREIEHAKVRGSDATKRDKVLGLFITEPVDSIIGINLPDAQIIKEIQRVGVKKIISLQEKDEISNSEYGEMKDITSVSYPLLDNGIIVRNKFPENRLKSEVVVAYCKGSSSGQFSLHNDLVYLEYCMTYSTTGTMIVMLPKSDENMLDLLRKRWTVDCLSADKTFLRCESSLLL